MYCHHKPIELTVLLMYCHRKPVELNIVTAQSSELSMPAQSPYCISWLLYNDATFLISLSLSLYHSSHFTAVIVLGCLEGLLNMNEEMKKKASSWSY
jgi:hypothetical protein